MLSKWHGGHGKPEARVYTAFLSRELDDYRRRMLELEWQLSVAKKVPWGFRFHLGDRSSETPVDVLVAFFGIALFFSVAHPDLGGLCEAIGRGEKRDIALRFSDGEAHWDWWYDPQQWSDHDCGSRWKWTCRHHGNIYLNPVRQLLGPKGRVSRLIDVAMGRSVVIGKDTYTVNLELYDVIQTHPRLPEFLQSKKSVGKEVIWRSPVPIVYGPPSRRGGEPRTSIMGHFKYSNEQIDQGVLPWETVANMDLTLSVLQRRFTMGYRE